MLVETCEEAGVYNNKLQEEAVEETLKKFAAEGVEIIHVDRSEFAEAARAFYSLPEFTNKWSKGLYETVKEAMKK